jgi:hypothetical protein
VTGPKGYVAGTASRLTFTTFAVAVIVTVTGFGLHLNVMTPPSVWYFQQCSAEYGLHLLR